MKKFAFLSIFIVCITTNAQVQTIEPGNTASGFSLKNIDGKMISVNDFPEAKGFILVFTANTCPYAIAYEDRLIALNERFAPRGYPVIAINPNPPKLSLVTVLKKCRKRRRKKVSVSLTCLMRIKK
ncbi:redoxin domain-containing protein [Antarcticibacterium sp. 1MA-6-2]|uniref:redoxin domain-containing protein n=1 Tax=Antarcticibacterium sp. 1MA-6-2 TaxID=2908210 RepID=UPI001F246237|nr:redoxin domain-containing protein [Antarcticibacterium sp. 1MA-6-2]UJH92156.1 redoxin domain-containing protein [Antarcticibacterium sp. 1MA-6-2]